MLPFPSVLRRARDGRRRVVEVDCDVVLSDRNALHEVLDDCPLGRELELLPAAGPSRGAVLNLLIVTAAWFAAAILPALPAHSAASTPCLTPLNAADSPKAAAEAAALLPLLPPDPGDGVIDAARPSTQGQVAPAVLLRGLDPDRYQTLYGYAGPFYNTSVLDGQVPVLERSVYSWPTPAWKSSGLVRNQTRCTIRVVSVTAHLLDASGEVLGVATGTSSVAVIRPGEPAPFVAEAPVSSAAVHAIKWTVDYEATASSPGRRFTFSVFFDQVATNGVYSVAGSVLNAASDTVATELVAAWFDDQERVVFVDRPLIAVGTGAPDQTEYRQTAPLGPGSFARFFYANHDAISGQVLERSELALWGTEK